MSDATKFNDYLCGDLAGNGGRQLYAVSKRDRCCKKASAVADIHYCQQCGDRCGDCLFATTYGYDAGIIGVYGSTYLVDDSLNQVL